MSIISICCRSEVTEDEEAGDAGDGGEASEDGIQRSAAGQVKGI